MYKLLLNFILILFISCTNNSTTSSNRKFQEKEEYYILRGMNNSQEGKYLEAIRELKAAYQKNPKNIITLRELAYCYGELGDLKEAETIYGEALKIDPKDLISLKNLAYLNYLQKNIPEAKEYLQKIPDKLKDEFSYMLYGFIYLDEKNYDAAYENLKMAINLNRSFNKELIIKYVEILRQKRRVAEIYSYMDQSYKIYNGRKEFVLLYSEILSENFNELKRAERILKRYLAEHNKDDTVLLELAKNQIEQKKYIETLEILSLVSTKNSYDPRYLNYKKIAEERLKNKY